MTPLDALNSTSASAPPTSASDERLRLIRDGLVNNSSTVVSGALGLLLVPLMIHRLGSDDYGIWVAAFAVAGVVAVVDFGLGWSVTNQAATRSDEAARVLPALAALYVALGLIGALLIAVSGLGISLGLHLPHERTGPAREVFLLVGVAFVADQITAYAVAALAGLRRFATLNAVAVAAALIRVGGIIALLEAGTGIVGVAAWQLAAAIAGAAIAMVALARAEPRYVLRRVRSPDVRALRPHLGFGATSLLATAASGLILQTASIVIGLIKGSAALTAYNVGQRFPLVASVLVWRAGQVIFPAVSEAREAQDRARLRELLSAGTRSVVLLAVPLCIVLGVLSRPLLDTWLGSVGGDSVTVMRLTSAMVLVDALGIAAMLVLWAGGAVRTVLALLTCFAAAQIALGPLLVDQGGVVAAAWLLLVLTLLTSLGLVHRACRLTSTHLSTLLREVQGIGIPAALCTAVALSVEYLDLPHRWPDVLTVSALAGVVYVAALLAHGARPEERAIARRLLPLAHARSGWYFMHVFADAVRDSGQRARAELDREFQQHDPWSYGSPRERERFARELELIDSVAGSRRFATVLEIGCAEGIFTERLAPRCDSLLAVDVNETALERARERCRHLNHVRFRRWDLRTDEPPGRFDLVVATSVLEFLKSPRVLSAARSRLATAVDAGGLLLVGNVRQSDVVERAWWARLLPRGGLHVNAFVAEHPELDVVAETGDEHYMEVVLMKKSDPE